MSNFTKALEVVGGPSAMARILIVTPQAVCFWRDGKREIPADRCPAIERATNGAVRCEDLRPDVDWAYLRNTAPVNAENTPILITQEAA